MTEHSADSLTLTDQTPLDQEAVRAQRLDELAQQLARHQAASRRPGHEFWLEEHLRVQEALLRAAYEHFVEASQSELALSYAAEWLLDNFYVVQQALRQIREDMPQGYYRQLPKLDAGPLQGEPRIYALAREFIRASDYHLELDRLRRFTQVYQDVAPLTMGELWAFPTMLRVGLLEALSQALARITGIQWPGGAAPRAPALTAHAAADENVVASSIPSLRWLHTQNWKEFFESVSQVEQILRDDPEGFYAQMDFETRDRYRKVVEALALATDWNEEAVAGEAIRLAQQGDARIGERTSARAGHVGFYLVDRGRAALEAHLDYRPAWGVRVRRWSFEHPTLVYLGSIGLLMLILLFVLLRYAVSTGGSPLQVAALILLGLVPAMTVAVAITNWAITHTVSPRVLPKLDFSAGIPPEYPTMVVVPALLSSAGEVDDLLQQLELHFLRNPDPQLTFALLTDLADAPQEQMPDDGALLEQAQAGIQALNTKYRRPGAGPFALFHRHRVWNPREAVWMGWERKRGKLTEFNRLLRGSQETSFTAQLGDREGLARIKYVITLDADTVLPRDSANRLVATLAHPLNRAEFDLHTGAVIAGYTVLQPRTEITPTSANQSLFTQVFVGDIGLDLYTRAVSDVYQDLFGEGIYVGKGIYDVDAFERSLAGRVPENALLSHDLFEGIHGRAGLVTDIILYEEYPAHYLILVRRSHRWVRGDWQLLPWLLPRVPHAIRGTIPNDLSIIDRWKILDNLRRSLLAPALLALFVAGWLWLPGSVPGWMVMGLLVPAVPLLLDAVTTLIRGLRSLPFGERPGRAVRDLLRPLRDAGIRWLLALALLPYETLLVLDAVGTTLIRLFITRRHLLQWTSAALTARLIGAEVDADQAWQQMTPSLLLTLVLGALVGLVNPAALPVVAPLLLVWLLSPQIAFWISRPRIQEPAPLTVEQRQQLRTLARRTWFYFEQFVGPEDHWLAPDHFQQAPRGYIAHRTSPTNIGLLLLATLSAYDFGYLGPLGLTTRLRDAFEGMDGLERHRGHWLNWYDTRTLESLPPRYVSTVDSGNLAASLWALAQACQALPQTPFPRWERWEGLLDTLAVLAEVVEGLDGEDLEPQVALVRSRIAHIRQEILTVGNEPGGWVPLLLWLAGESWPQLERALAELVSTKASRLDTAGLRSLRVWVERMNHQLLVTRREQELLQPWLFLLHRPPTLFTQAGAEPALTSPWQALVEALPPAPPLSAVPALCEAAGRRLAALQVQLEAGSGPADQREAAGTWCRQLAERLEGAGRAAESLLGDFRELAERAEAFVREMEFGFLFDLDRQVFHIGYNVDTGRLDDNYYDLLASEARIASLVAIGKGDVPQSHWLHLGRPLTQVERGRVLLSWSGTMFEYLMPALLMRRYEGTLLGQSDRVATEHQIAYGRQTGTPWGISESGYYRFDANLSYQYRAFGVPGLGFKRGLADDLVIAPYASLLALPLRPQAVLQNIARFAALAMLGDYGLHEAVDYTPSRLSLGQKYAVVRSFMAHHQGMILLSLVNYLQDGVMVRRFHADPRVQSVDLLLQEQVPQQAPIQEPPSEEIRDLRPAQPAITAVPWRVPVHTPMPQVHFLSNGRYGLLVTSAGGGYSSWEELALTRWRADTTQDDWGTWVYVQDLESEALWSAGYQPTAAVPHNQEVFFSPHMVEFRRHEHEIFLSMKVTVAPDADVEIRRVTLTNQSDRPRRLLVTSYGEVVLAPQDADQRHPAFTKLFIESEYLPAVNGLLFRRRPRSAQEAPIYLAHALVVEAGGLTTGAYESDRGRFLGRGRTTRAPAALTDGSGPAGTSGATLDPVMVLSQEIDLAPHAAAHLAYLTIATTSRQQALALAQRYQAWPTIERAFEQARAQSELELRQFNLSVPELERVQQLLSLLLYPHPALRADPATLAANSKGQPGLWGFAISGDYPILLVRISNDEELPLVRELLRAHAYWRDRKLQIDLVILNQEETGYAQEVQGSLHRLLALTGNDAWLNQRGGIFVLRSDQMNAADRVLLETAARAILDGSKGGLAEQLEGLLVQPTRLPALVPSLSPDEAEEPMPPLERPADLLFDNGLGGFSADGREYVIFHEPGRWTPAPWINVIANPHFGFLVSEAGVGYSWAINSGENRLSPWSNDQVSDRPGEVLYLRDEETAEVWSPTPLPAAAPGPYLVRHGAGYTIFEHHSHGLKQRLRCFAVPDAPVKVVQLRLENTWGRGRRVTATYYVPWVLGTFRDRAQQYIQPAYEAEHWALLARNPYNVEFGERVAFLATSKEPHGLTTDRAEFLGRMGVLGQPAALERVGLAGTVRPGLDPCAAMQLHLDLQPGEAQEIYFLLGEGADQDEALRLVAHYQVPGQVEAAWEAATTFWDGVLGAVVVQTPDRAMNLLLNRWLLYQDLACRVWGRSAFYQSSGAYGFRDQLQDVMALLFAAPEMAREQILRAARHQFDAGDVLHWWHPPAGRGVRTRISDDLLWLPFVTAHYVTTTGDTAILSEKVPFLRGEPLEPDEEERYGLYESTSEVYSLYEHCRRAVAKGTTAGPHGLPLMKAGDWNDGMNRVGIEGRGESIWLGWFLYAVLTRFAPIAELMDDSEQAAADRARAEQLRQALEASGWDGEWYLRAYYDDGSPLGSAQNLECRIDSIAQSWAILSGAGDPARSAAAMAAVTRHLVRYDDRLVLLFTPPFDQTPHDPGYIKGYVPGIRENGGQYTHAALWAVWAFAESGDADRAEALFQMLNPICHGDTPEKIRRYRVEPYVVAADVYSEAPHVGRGGWTWYTGSAGWMYRLGVEAILGLRRVGQALRVDPCIPQAWSSYQINYYDGERCYHIRVENPDGVNRGVRQIVLDGEILRDGEIPLAGDSGWHEVSVVLGRSSP